LPQHQQKATFIMAGGTKRMSAEEKRKAILGVYHKTKSVYTEKEIIMVSGFQRRTLRTFSLHLF
jgi:hypothetical protein